MGGELSHKQLKVLRFIDQRGISTSKILDIFETENGNVEVYSVIIFKNYKVKDTVEKKSSLGS